MSEGEKGEEARGYSVVQVTSCMVQDIAVRLMYRRVIQLNVSKSSSTLRSFSQVESQCIVLVQRGFGIALCSVWHVASEAGIARA